MARNTRKERARERERQRQAATQAKLEQQQRANWQAIVDDAHAEALIEDSVRTSQARIQETQDLHDYIKQQKNQYDAQVRLDNTYNPIFDVSENTIPPNIDEIHERALKENVLFDEANLAAQKEARVNNIVQEVLESNTPQEAQSALNAKVRNKDISLEDSKAAKSIISSELNARKQKLNVPVNKATNSYRVSPGNAINRDSYMKLASPVGEIKLNTNPELFPTMENKFRRETTNAIRGTVSEGTDDLAKSHLKKALSGRNLNALLNIGFAMNDYHEARNAGDGVLKAGVKAGAQFVAGEALGMWMMPVMMAKSVPTLAISAVETAQTVTRKMNSINRTQVFGEAQFQDTQQLATMRQAGMEMAKMSQYNLQQAIMGNEAQYMHRL